MNRQGSQRYQRRQQRDGGSRSHNRRDREEEDETVLGFHITKIIAENAANRAVQQQLDRVLNT